MFPILDHFRNTSMPATPSALVAALGALVLGAGCASNNAGYLESQRADGDGTSGGSAAGGDSAAGGISSTGGGFGLGGGFATGGSFATGGIATVSTATGGASTGTGGVSSAAGGGSTVGDLPLFSFFVTSLEAMRRLSGSQNGFGGDLRYGEADGLTGADKICTEIAEYSMPGAGQKGWRAFLSTTAVDAIDRIGEGPWYDRLGRVVAMNKTALLNTRPEGADPAIIDDLPNEYGVPNNNPDNTGNVDNHDVLTGSDTSGRLYSGTQSNCNDWTSVATDIRPRVGHSWPTSTGGGNFGGGNFGGGIGGGMGDMAHWISCLDENGCAPGVNLNYSSVPDGRDGTVGGGGGYGAIYCFALTP
jgi:hypothetical protein